MEAHELKNCEKLFQNIVFFCMLSCQNTVNTSVFGWFALTTESKKMKKTVVFAVHLKPLVEKNIAKHSVFYAFAKKTNNDVFGRILPLTLQKQCKPFFFF